MDIFDQINLNSLSGVILIYTGNMLKPAKEDVMKEKTLFSGNLLKKIIVIVAGSVIAAYGITFALYAGAVAGNF